MTGETSVVAARLKNLQPSLNKFSFHCICHKLTVANSDADRALKPVKDPVSNLSTARKFFRKQSEMRRYIFTHAQKEMHKL